MDKKKAAQMGSLTLAKVQTNHTIEPIKTTERQAQRAYLLAALQEGRPLSTLELRAMGIMHPAGRVRELRNSGYNIPCIWQHRADETGLIHRVGVYSLLGGEV